MIRRHSGLRSTMRGSLALLLVLAGGARVVAGAEDVVKESWDAVYLGGAKIGHIHTYVEKVPDNGREYQRVRLDIEMRLKRGEDETVIKLRYGTIENLDGEVFRLDTRTEAGENQDIRVHGDVIKHRMNLTIDVSGHKQSRVIDWSPDVRGPYGAEQSMAARPMKEHEKRRIRLFMPELNKIADVSLEARTIEPVLLGDGSRRPLLRVDQLAWVDGKRQPELDARVFVDSQGQVIKSEQDIMGGMVYYRTTKEAALAPGGPIRFDMILESVVKVARKIPNPDQTRHIKYRVTLNGSDPSKAFPNDARQTLHTEVGSASPVLEIQSVGPTDGEAVAAEVAPEYLKPNAVVTSDDVRVRGLATRVTRGLVDPWQKATAINGWVAQNMRDKNFKVAFAAANEVARNLSGDCTEHSVLAAAMCRAVGIPSRVAIGMVYVDELGGFGYHMWDEVFVNNRWVAIDPSFNQTTVDAVHIKLSDSSLDGVSPFQAFMPMVLVVNRLTIEPIEIR